jgi:hypothetical protein
MKLKLCILFFSFYLVAGAQIGFQKYYSEPIEYQQFRYSGFDNTYVIAGCRFVGGTVYDFCAMKIGVDGTVLWTKAYPSLNDEFLASLSISNSGDILLGGYKSSSAGDNDFSLIKTDPSGNLLWHKTYGTSHTEGAVFAGEDASGNYLMAGNREGGNDPMVMKLNSAGGLLWSKTFGTSAASEQADVAVITADGGLLLAGDFMGVSAFTMKLSSSGAVQWSNSYSSLHTPMLASVKQTSDGGYIYASTDYRCDSSGCFPFFAFIREDSAGNVLWAKAVEGFYGWGRAALETADGGFAITGQLSDTAGGGKFPALIKTNSNGDLQWARMYGSAALTGESFFLEEAPAGGFSLFGVVNSGADYIRTDANGFSGCFENTVNPVLSDINFAKSGSIVIPEKVFSDSAGQSAVTAVPFAVVDSIICEVSGIQEVSGAVGISIFPNPFSETATVQVEKDGTGEIQFTMYDVFGRAVSSGRSSASVFMIRRSELAAGVYMLRITADGQTALQKVVIQ